MVGGSGFQPRFTRAIAVKNRSHNPKSTDTKLPSFFFDQTGRFSGQGGARTKLHGMTNDD